MSARAFRKEYLRLRSVAKEEARRKQIKMKPHRVLNETTSVVKPSEEVVVTESNGETNKEICIVCSTKSELDTVCCDECQTWCHFDCVGLTPEIAEEINKWYCPICVIKV